ncbi:MAG: chemotaxis protein CheW [Treponema sp.]|nr:chemotaxis protein CheW [Treponema sp.]
MDEDILKTIEENDTVSQKENTADEKHRTWLIFDAGSRTYAADATKVREILRNDEIFPVPFVPKYIKGVINYYGRPYAAVDFSLFQNDEQQNSKLFLILNDENDVAIQISDVREFQTLKEDYLQTIARTAESAYFSNAIDYDDGIQHIAVPVLNFESITARIRQDFENE